MTVEESRALAVAINSLRFNPDLSDIEVQSYEMALANIRDRMQEETGLTPGGIANWIYRSINSPDSEFDKTIRAVESALGFKLFVWQKAFIERGEFRCMGATTAEILRDLLDVSALPIDYSEPERNFIERFYRWELRGIKLKLCEAGIPTRTVFFSKKDKWEYFRGKKEG